MVKLYLAADRPGKLSCFQIHGLIDCWSRETCGILGSMHGIVHPRKGGVYTGT